MNIGVGQMVPFFSAAALEGNPNYCFDSAAGRPVVLLFMGSGRMPQSAAALALLARHQAVFDDKNASFFGVTIDPSDAAEGRIARRLPGIRWFLDYDTAVSSRYGLVANHEDGKSYTACWLLLDSMLRVVKSAPISKGEDIFTELEMMVDRGDEQTHAPVLMVPRVFEPELCRRLIDLYEQKGGSESGFMRERDGLTVPFKDPNFKRRSDYIIEDLELRELLVSRLRTRLLPQIARAFQFEATRIERWIVACYDSETGGFFRPHRDNTTAGTAHRNFACTINLNAEEYAGGELRFPEFGARTYRAPTGGAVVFACPLLHEALPVTSGRRYAFLPFLYDDERAKIREQNRKLIVTQLGGQPAGGPTIDAAQAPPVEVSRAGAQ